jgi:hypothetical protein
VYRLRYKVGVLNLGFMDAFSYSNFYYFYWIAPYNRFFMIFSLLRIKNV